ncbi:PAS domain-containing hybrid sensor histidine kinase/response regulator [Desulfosoma caldarium]|uniref:histidine kinase n=1 Tax=Desulfosoma caldarium TaxID=610254 RepID=A0A3N1UG41_9BACT|nr:PAS domain-containing sensor histidine kinase [Desulfosoma caldarium]ROQ90234.1 PAS domain S-box-containing protein [Desulfosoma caldarium]
MNSHETEHDLRLQKAYFEAIFDFSPDAVAILDAQDRVVMINQAFTRLFQYTAQEARGAFINDLVARRHMRADAENLSVRALQGFSVEVETRRERKDGTLVDVAITAAPIYIDGVMVAIYASYRDITARKQAEQALRDMDKKYRLIVDHSTDAVFVVQDERVIFWNPMFRNLCGYTDEEIPRLHVAQLLHPKDRDSVLTLHRKRLAGETVPGTYTFRALSKDGRTLWINLNAIAVQWDGKPATINSARDFTREKELEAQLAHAQKMEAVGTLAGGIAHDFNNLLQTIQGYAELLANRADSHDIDRQRLDKIFDAVQRGRELTRNLLTFSRKMEPHLRRLNLNRELAEMQDILSHTLPKMITVRLETAPELPAVHADPSQVAQVIMNLAVNAKDAMPDGGTLTLKTQCLTLPQGHASGLKPGDYVCLSVEDTGTGMPETVRQRIFEPFFTTKPSGSGTGLGLSMVYGIMASHQGTVLCHSVPGQGTRFDCLFPALPEAASEVDSPPRQQAPTAPPAHATVLLVDDEEHLRVSGREMLEFFGHRVLTAADGEEALTIFAQEGSNIDVVLLDLIMPGMGGRKCLEKLLALRPNAKIIVASGFSANDSIQDILMAGAFDFLAKPYSVETLLGKIAEALKAP